MGLWAEALQAGAKGAVGRSLGCSRAHPHSAPRARPIARPGGIGRGRTGWALVVLGFMEDGRSASAAASLAARSAGERSGGSLYGECWVGCCRCGWSRRGSRRGATWRRGCVGCAHFPCRPSPKCRQMAFWVLTGQIRDAGGSTAGVDAEIYRLDVPPTFPTVGAAFDPLRHIRLTDEQD